MHAPNDLTTAEIASSIYAVSLATEEAEAYHTHVQNYADQSASRTPRIRARPIFGRSRMAHQACVVSLEMNIYALGREQFQEEVAHRDPAQRSQFLELRTFLAYEKQLRNLQTQEARLRRYSARDAAELKSLQAARQAEEQECLTEAAELYLAAKSDGESFDPAEYGFEFSTSEIERFLQTGQAANTSTATRQQRPLRTAA